MHSTNIFQCGTWQSLAKGKFSHNQDVENAKGQKTGKDPTTDSASK